MIKKIKIWYRYYSLFSLIKLFFYYLNTKINYPNARFIRGFPDIRGRKNIKFGNNFTCGKDVRIETNPKEHKITLFIGNDVEFNDRVHITSYSKVTIGNNVLLASNIYISDTIHGSYLGNQNDSSPRSTPNSRNLTFKDVYISDNVWIGEGVSILPGVIIGKGVIIGSNSVVTKSIPDFTIAVGNPAKIVKKFNFLNNKWEKIV